MSFEETFMTLYDTVFGECDSISKQKFSSLFHLLISVFPDFNHYDHSLLGFLKNIVYRTA
jgi:hypothetical protein